jgi:hypothetical protein
MKSRKHAVLMAGVILAAAAGSLGARAADQSAFFEQQREITDGYYPQYGVTDPVTSAESTDGVSASANIVDTIAQPFEHQSSAGSVDGLTASESDGGGR